MPTSDSRNVPYVLDLVYRMNPKSILDLGVGFGRYGFLCREVLETQRTNVYKKEDWKVRIDGIEGFKPYIGPHQESIYNTIEYFNLDTPGGITAVGTNDYDLYLAIDILQHLHNWSELLEAIPDEASIIATVPYGPYPQGALFGNELERHVITFTPDMLKETGAFNNIAIAGNTLICFRCNDEVQNPKTK